MRLYAKVLFVLGCLSKLSCFQISTPREFKKLFMSNQPSSANTSFKRLIERICTGAVLTTSALLVKARYATADPDSIAEAARFATEVQKTRDLTSDEFNIIFDDDSLGLGLTETIYQGFPIVTVSGIKKTDLVINHKELRIGAVVVEVGGASVDGLPLKTISDLVKISPRPVRLKFRDPSRYNILYIAFIIVSFVNLALLFFVSKHSSLMNSCTKATLSS